MSLVRLRNSLEWALLVALVLGGGAIAQAQNENKGKIVQIGPGDGNDAAITVEDEAGTATVTPEGAEQPAQPELPKHWIGIVGSPVTPELRAQIDLPEGQGLLVRQVVPDSPAAKAGLKNFDILLRANDTDLADMGDLMELVRTEGQRGGKITLEVLRHGKRETLWITPEARPEKVAGVEPGMPGEGGQGWGFGAPGPGQEDAFRFFEKRFGEAGPGRPFQFRVFGPGTVLNGRVMNLDQMPSGLSVSIQKQDNQPAQITVKRGDETWNIVGDDPGSLEQLPDDVRPFVEQLLAGSGPMRIPLPAMPNIEIPNMPVPPVAPGAPGGFNAQELQQRLEAMEKHLEELQKQLEAQFGAAHEQAEAE
jgi:hypothetical protein